MVKSGYRRQIGRLEISIVLASTLLLLQLIGPGGLRVWREWPRPGHQTPASALLQLDDGRQLPMQYLVFLPNDYCAGRQFPLLLYLHGSSERGDDLEIVKRRGLPAIIEGGRRPPMIVISPQCPSEINWNSGTLLALLDHVERQFSVDRDRVYVAGNSLGGYGTWRLIATLPERFAAAVPVAAGGAVNVKILVGLPIWAFHGALDKTVPIEGTEKMIAALHSLGSNARLTIYPDLGHGICDLTFQRDDLYDWLLQQNRTRQ